MPNNFNTVTCLEVTAMGTDLKIKLEMSKELKEKIEEYYETDCAYKYIVQAVLGVADFENEVDTHLKKTKL